MTCALCVCQCVQPGAAGVRSPDGEQAAVPRAGALLERVPPVGADHQRAGTAGRLRLLPGLHRPDRRAHEGQLSAAVGGGGVGDGGVGVGILVRGGHSLT